MSCSSTAAKEFTTKKESLLLNWPETVVESNGSFQMYHLKKIQRCIRKSTNKIKRGVTRKAHPGLRPLIPSKFGGGFRYPTFLEQQLLPMMNKGDNALTALSSDKSKGEQLTIFYDGVVNVYDNVSVDKAKAIMLLAGEISVSAPVTKNVQEHASKISPKSISPPVYKLQSNLSIATKHSLERFFNKRRDRLMDKSSCVTTSPAHPKDDCQAHKK
ncbi:putative Jasmonate-zim-domain protein 12 [Abeliophyllum distichum]|uniref:Protein TIFY n=1 Tax=Abeliophyllum distichum TaxID=126358 RepID=A0ABD1P9G8_9LAMI